MILHVSPDKGKSFQRAHYPYQLSEHSALVPHYYFITIT